ncbi:hypothetical protein EUX98_g672 [Antrodiella citrinella]|uniref:Exonuclease domain-containing protein n=1 Tax=Antrodiella citrinella TaxID=2447956 RepID=A0A4V3XJL6_9APHY|nr:hypothetical protein EUX98_g672 [Antrodiella citrinella]
MSKAAPTPAQIIGLACTVVGVGPGGSTHMLARVAVVDYRGQTLFEAYVLPTMPVSDYRTSTTGIEAEHLAPDSALPFQDVQNRVADLMKGKVVVGHSLWLDLSVLGIPHPAVATRDVALYQPFRNALRSPNQVVGLQTLMWRLMNRRAQDDKQCAARASTDPDASLVLNARPSLALPFVVVRGQDMASGGWFSHNLKRHSIDEPSNKPSFDASASVSQADDGKAPADGRSLQRTVTAPLSTPHDAVMSELTGVTETDAARRSDAPSSAVPLNRDASTSGGGPAEDASTQDPGSAQAARSAATTPKPVPSSGIENVYDPYTGNIAGMLYPRIAEPTSAFDPDAATSSKKKDSLQVDADKDELWSHLARIRDLQGEIAGMHVRMEGVGSADGGRGGQKRPQGPGSRMRTDTIGAGDEWVDAEQEANARKKAKDAEFTKLAESFEGRRAAIDGMMDKVCVMRIVRAKIFV